jgi:hypothetical protein
MPDAKNLLCDFWGPCVVIQTSHESFHVTSHATIESLQEAVRGVQYKKGTTFTAKAMREALQTFQAEERDNSQVSKVQPDMS